MRIAILPTAARAASVVARAIATTLTRAPQTTLALPTGHTSIPLYAALVDLHRAGRADFGRARCFNLDELAGLAPADPRSFHAFMRVHLFDHVNLPQNRAHFLNGAARDWRREIRRFERALAAADGLDLAIVGIGTNGHVAFNEPASVLAPNTHRVRLSASTRRANADAFGGRSGRVPTHALTMGMATIFRARRIILLATGRSKARIVHAALQGAITTRVPASWLQAHPDVWVVCDARAASGLRSRG